MALTFTEVKAQEQPQGHSLLTVYFTDEQGRSVQWRPRWTDVWKVFLLSFKVERSNQGREVHGFLDVCDEIAEIQSHYEAPRGWRKWLPIGHWPLEWGSR